jgi:hypothetical protein
MKSKKDKRKCIDCKTWIGFMAFNATRCKPCQATHKEATLQSEKFKAKKRAYQRAYYQQPDVKAKQRAYQRAYSKIRSEIANQRDHQVLEQELKKIRNQPEVLA